MKLNRIGIDLAKNVFQLHGVDDQGKVVLMKRLSREKWLGVFCHSIMRIYCQEIVANAQERALT
jgi:hypothetical protein